MAQFEDQEGAAVKVILSDCLVTVVEVRWYDSEAIEITNKDRSGEPHSELVYGNREPCLEIIETVSPGASMGTAMFRLVEGSAPSGTLSAVTGQLAGGNK
jgi:hypothetical protein